MSEAILCVSAFECQMTNAPVHLSSLCVQNGVTNLRFIKALLSKNFYFEVVDESGATRVERLVGEFSHSAMHDRARISHCQPLTDNPLASLVAVLKKLNGANS